jgi:hypothetical protein
MSDFYRVIVPSIAVGASMALVNLCGTPLALTGLVGVATVTRDRSSGAGLPVPDRFLLLRGRCSHRCVTGATRPGRDHPGKSRLPDRLGVRSQ